MPLNDPRLLNISFVEILIDLMSDAYYTKYKGQEPDEDVEELLEKWENEPEPEDVENIEAKYGG